ncbi:MAG: ABC transporter permease [Gammaproteobacteria bacterium]|jgi:ABC-type lipoprotein release transport system permease subunit
MRPGPWQFSILLKLSWRNLWRNGRRTGIMLAAISVGIWAMIFMTALMRGMVDDMLAQGIRNLPGDIQIQHPDYLDDPSVVNSIAEPRGELLEALQTGGAHRWAPRIRVPAVIASERESRGVELIGVVPGAEQEISGIPAQITEGRFLESPRDNGLVIGARLAKRLETRLGKRVVIMSQDPDNNISERGYRIVGIYHAEIAALEERRIYAGLADLQQLLGIGDRISQIIVYGEDYRDVDARYQSLARVLPDGLDMRPWYRIDTYLSAMFKMMDGFVLVWVIIIFLALSFGLVNTLVMAIFERVREIGLTQALGMRPSQIVVQVLLESLLLLLIGLAVGNVLAIATVKPLEGGLDVSIVAEGMAMMGAGSVLYPTLTLHDLLLGNIVVIVLGILTSILPAWRAAQLDPIRALNMH